MDFLKFLNPFHYVSPERYYFFWENFFRYIFFGLGARILAAVFLFLSLWFVFRRKRFGVAIIFYLMSYVLTYAGGVIHFLKLIYFKAVLN